MNKAIKKIMGIAFAAAMALSISVGAFATEPYSDYEIQSYSTDVAGETVRITYNVDSIPVPHPNVLYFSTPRSHSVNYTPASGAAATVRFIDANSLDEAARINIPVSAAGIPSNFLGTISLPAGYYQVIITSNSDTHKASGTFVIYDVDAVLS